MMVSMQMKRYCSIMLVLLCLVPFAPIATAQEPIIGGRVRLAAYNVLFGNWGEPQRVAEMLQPYDLDIIGFSEVPGGDWTERVGHVLGMKHVYVGEISSANHKDKYKSILSRTPLAGTHEIAIKARGWSPASLVGAETVVRGVPILVYSTHIPGRPAFTDQADGSAAEFIADSVILKTTARNFVILGDLNNLTGDGPLKRIESKGMRSAWSDLNIDTTRLSTHIHIETGKESGVIDHIYFNEASGAKAIQGGIIYNAFNPPREDKEMPKYKVEWEQYGKPLSDHRPVWAVLRFDN
jgi:maltose 6'-phosphate phosphatase